MSDVSDELDQIIKDSLESPWRMNLIVQFMVFAIVEVIIAAIIRLLPLSESSAITYFVLSLAIFYPFIIKEYGRLFKSIGFGFFGAAVSVLAYNLALRYGLSMSRIADVALYILIMEIIGIFLLRHVAIEFRVTKTTTIYVFDAIASIVFFTFIMLFFYGLGVDIITNLMASIILTVIFTYSILPEHIV
ncbi:MAG: hypothetical protein ACP6IP_06300 [Candidatus Njordarchaeia archaeon]